MYFCGVVCDLFLLLFILIFSFFDFFSEIHDSTGDSISNFTIRISQHAYDGRARARSQ